MAKQHLDPGPPLIPEPEFCESDPPSGVEYARAVGTALLVVTGGAVVWVVVVLITQRLWGLTTVLLGVAAGWAINRAAGRHRSISLGVMAAVASLLAAVTGYGLLWLPFFESIGSERQLSWYDLIMGALGAFVAYRLAGPRSADGKANN